MGLTVQQLEASLWQECDRIYAQHQATFIGLQDEYGLNINLLLLAIWLDRQAVELTVEHWQQLSKEIDDHDRQVLLPYRQLRKLSKPHLTREEYQKMLEVELMLERKTQKLILEKLDRLKVTPHKIARVNCHYYLSLFDEKASLIKLS